MSSFITQMIKHVHKIRTKIQR